MSSAAPRFHIGAGAFTVRRETSVFINCPFDAEYQGILDAIVFSSLCCGFLPRSALETGSAAIPRMDRIVNAIRSSRYSIHDLSRCKGEGDKNLARFNMPLELGIAMGEGFNAKEAAAHHDWLAIVPVGHLYKQFLSDLAGYDPRDYDGSARGVVPAVMAWLATRPDAVQTPKPYEVLAALPQFNAARQRLCSEWCEQVPWTDLLMAGMGVARDNGLIPPDESGRGDQ